ncbi:MAG: erythromycin biosynthesis sensory transduction protein eryC1, partial [Actinobacteria bacterium]
MKVPFVDLRTQGTQMLEEFDSAFRDIVTRAAYTLGPECAAFDADFAAYTGCS